MIETLITQPGQVLNYIVIALVIIFFTYTLGRSLLEVRQIKILQQKVKTNIDSTLNILNIVYILIQLAIFVIIFLIM